MNSSSITGNSRLLLTCIILLLTNPASLKAQFELHYNSAFTTNGGNGDFAPYYISSNTHGTVTQPFSAQIRIAAHHDMDMSKRFSYGFGADVIGGVSDATSYKHYDLQSQSLADRNAKPSALWLQQLYADVKYRCLSLTVGLKERGSRLLNDKLSSGDITWSANSRPMPGIYGSFIDFQDVPFTNGWLQIEGSCAYYKPTDNKWLENHYNYASGFITTGSLLNYKHIYFRSNPDKAFSLTLGMQASCQIGGTKEEYLNGKIISSTKMDASLKDLLKAVFPRSGGSNTGDQVYYEGNHLGSWDILGTYRFQNGTILKAYYQSPWEDGSGIGKLNGFDGLYGIEYANPNPQGIITGTVIEYLDFTNQSGPMHWAPDDFPGTTITSQATGADDYYNNYAYNGYQLYGMSIGTPFLKSTLYNRNGYLQFTDTRTRGFHIGVSGNALPRLSYRTLLSYRKSWGTPYFPSTVVRDNISFLLEASYCIKRIKGMSVAGQFGLDHGNLYGNNCGLLFTVKYAGLLNL